MTKGDVIIEIEKFIESKLRCIVNDDDLNIDEKREAYDVICNTHKFLRNYERNSKLLNDDFDKKPKNKDDYER